MEAKVIDLQGWKYFGEGGSAITYIRDDDEGIMLKLNNPEWAPEAAEHEFVSSKNVYDCGIASPQPLEYVTDGNGRYGMTVEKLQKKRSFYRILSQEPEKMDELAERFAFAAKKLLSTECDTSKISSLPQKYYDAINSCPLLSDRIKDSLNEIISSLKPATTCLHGDLHAGNIIECTKGDVWIDLGDFGYGDPMLDLSQPYILSHYLSEEKTMNDFHIDVATNRKFYNKFSELFFGKLSPADQTELTAAYERLRKVRYGYYATSNPKIAQFIIPSLERLIP